MHSESNFFTGLPLFLMDWRDSNRLEVSFKHDTDTSAAAQPDNDTTAVTQRIVDITCTPCQHFTGWTPWDSFKTLWASWVVEEVIPDDLAKSACPPLVRESDSLAFPKSDNRGQTISQSV